MGTVESEPEIRDWLEQLPIAQLDGKLRELRFHLDGQAVRITYWIAAGRRIVLLTTFVKTRMREDREVERARRALARFIAEDHDTEGGET